MTLNGFYMIREREVKQAANGSLYANFVLQQQHTLLSAKLWDITDEQQEKFVPKAVVKVEGNVEVFRSKKQLTIQKIRLAVDEDKVNRTELISKKGLSREDLWHELRMMMDEVESPILQAIIKQIYGNRSIRDRLTTIPAAKKLHHAYYAGLLEQIVELMYVALQLLPLYQHVQKDIALTLCLLGDIGKVHALKDPLAPEYTDAGELMGQLVLSIEIINEAALEQAIEISSPELMAVKHGILAQYDQSEGGAVQPKTAEALFYYYVKRMNTDLRVLEHAQTEGSSFSYIDLFKRKMFVQSDQTKENDDELH
ncbi:CMP-binding protein [Shouchella patagoniensis]|uniref:CMP-binding protein n=1 Tax=Shouchella patagoniensis TaxID=228576 RepID=UPI0009951917|nr:CMP-binding protein [Shouchella patagoniensis]